MIRRASIRDISAVMGGLSPMQLVIAREYLDKGTAWCLERSSGPRVIAGLLPVGPNQAFAWFGTCPDISISELQEMRRAVKVTLPATGYSAIRTEVVTEAGIRLAIMVGFRPLAENLYIWRPDNG